MKNEHTIWKILRCLILPILAITLVAGGSAIWFYSADQVRTANLDTNIVKNKVKIDDIAENYSFASDLNANEFYNVYFFPTPMATQYASHTGGNTSESVTKTTTTIYRKLICDLASTTVTPKPNEYVQTVIGINYCELIWNDTDKLYDYTYSSSDNTTTYKYISFIDGKFKFRKSKEKSVKITYDVSEYLYSVIIYDGSTSNTLTLIAGGEKKQSTNDNNVTYSCTNDGKIYQFTTSNVTGSEKIEAYTWSNGLTYTDDDSDGIWTATDSSGVVHYWNKSTDTYYTRKGLDSSNKFTNPKDWYDYEWNQNGSSHTDNNVTTTYADTCNVYYHGDEFGPVGIVNTTRPRYAGFWGKIGDGTNAVNYKIYNPTTNTSDGSIFGYKSFENVYKQLSVSQYLELGDVASSMVDTVSNNSWMSYFAGFTSNLSIAQTNWTKLSAGTPNDPICELFNPSKPLSYYDTDGDKNIYFYALYTNNSESRSSGGGRKAAVKMVAGKKDNTPTTFNNEFIRYEDTDYNKTYFQKTCIVVKDGGSLGEDDEPQNNIYYKYSSSSESTDNLIYFGADGFSGTWESTYFNFSTNFNSYLDINSMYNLFVYFNYGNSSAANSVNEELRKKNIVKKYEQQCGNMWVGIYLEKIYDWKILTHSAETYDYDAGYTGAILYSSSGVTDNKEIIESNEIIIPHSEEAQFVVNFGEDYNNYNTSSDNVLTYAVDTSVGETSTTYRCMGVDNDGNEVQYSDTAGNLVYYTSAKIQAVTDTSSDSLISTNTQHLPMFKFTGSGVYKLRLEITYSSGKPTSVKLLAARLRGIFLELHVDNTSNSFDLIHRSDFINHTTKANTTTYRVFRTELDFGDNVTTSTEFYEVGNSSLKYTIPQLWSNNILSPSEELYDHVTDSALVITSAGFKINGNTAVSSYSFAKNYVFYAHSS